MLKHSIFYKTFIVLALLVGMYSCEMDDAEPDLQQHSFSRLYVSFEDYVSSDVGASVSNVRIIYPADSSEFTISVNHISNAKGGGPIIFDPFLKWVFQGSANRDGVGDTAVYAMAVGNTGALTNSSRLGNKRFARVTGLAYAGKSQVLFVANAGGIERGVQQDTAVYVLERPRQKSGYARTEKKLIARGMPFYGLAYASNTLYLSKTGANGGIYVVENIFNIPVNANDSTGTLSPTRTITIEGTNNVRGICYDTTKNILAVTDYPAGTVAVGQGRILLFENFSSLATQTSITPTRIITGTNTGLQQPVDVALDRRATGQYLYVADRATRKVLRFKISDEGNIAPDKSLTTDAMPVGLALDSRDDSTLD